MGSQSPLYTHRGGIHAFVSTYVCALVCDLCVFNVFDSLHKFCGLLSISQNELSSQTGAWILIHTYQSTNPTLFTSCQAVTVHTRGIICRCTPLLIFPIPVCHSVFKWQFVRQPFTFILPLIPGCHIGTVVTLSLSGWFIQSEWGWPSVFYVYGALSLVWSWFWFRHTYDSPDLHPTITVAEKCFIKQGIGDHRGKMVSHVCLSILLFLQWVLALLAQGQN